MKTGVLRGETAGEPRSGIDCRSCLTSKLKYAALLLLSLLLLTLTMPAESWALSATLTVNKTGNGTGTVTSDDGNIDCGTTCSHDYLLAGSVTLTATPDASSNFTSWSGCSSDSRPWSDSSVTSPSGETTPAFPMASNVSPNRKLPVI